jgi:hypothetical protein
MGDLMSQQFEIESIKRLDARPGDVLLVTLPEKVVSTATADQISRQFRAQLPGVKVLILAAGMSVEVVSAERNIADAVAEATANPGRTVETGHGA